MICGALQTLNEEACEDVLDESVDKSGIVAAAMVDQGELEAGGRRYSNFALLPDAHHTLTSQQNVNDSSSVDSAPDSQVSIAIESENCSESVETCDTAQ